jgi:hypothetical protein
MKLSVKLLGSVAALSLAVAAHAGTVSYSTLGSFDGSVFGTDVVTSGAGMTVRYVSASGNLVSTPSSIPLGTFTVEGANGSTPLDLSGNFYLRIIQTLPAGEDSVPEQLVADLMGTISMTGSTGRVMFGGGNQIQFESSTYYVGTGFRTDDFTVTLNPPNTTSSAGAGVTTLDGWVEGGAPDVVIPEPGTYAMLGSGLLSLVVLSRRRAARR